MRNFMGQVKKYFVQRRIGNQKIKMMKSIKRTFNRNGKVTQIKGEMKTEPLRKNAKRSQEWENKLAPMAMWLKEKCCRWKKLEVDQKISNRWIVKWGSKFQIDYVIMEVKRGCKSGKKELIWLVDVHYDYYYYTLTYL